MSGLEGSGGCSVLPGWILWCLYLGLYSVVPEDGAGFSTAVAPSSAHSKTPYLLSGHNEITWQDEKQRGL